MLRHRLLAITTLTIAAVALGARDVGIDRIVTLKEGSGAAVPPRK